MQGAALYLARSGVDVSRFLEQPAFLLEPIGRPRKKDKKTRALTTREELPRARENDFNQSHVHRATPGGKGASLSRLKTPGSWVASPRTVANSRRANEGQTC